MSTTESLVPQIVERFLEIYDFQRESDPLRPIHFAGLTFTLNQSGYVSTVINRPLDLQFVTDFFNRMSVYIENSQASIHTENQDNILIYAEADHTQRIAFGPDINRHLLLHVFRYLQSALGS